MAMWPITSAIRNGTPCNHAAPCERRVVSAWVEAAGGRGTWGEGGGKSSGKGRGAMSTCTPAGSARKVGLSMPEPVSSEIDTTCATIGSGRSR